MLAGFGVLLGIRERTDHEMPNAVATADVAEGDAGTDDNDGGHPEGGPAASREPAKGVGRGENTDAGATKRDSNQQQTDAAAPEKQPAKAPEKLLDRPLRVVGLGWEVIAPGLVANRGTTPGEGSLYKRGGLEVHFRSSTKVVELERALARGGVDERGADVAIIPLPVFVASYEQLRALSPRVFFVFGWSHGHEALMSFHDDPLLNLRRNRDIQLVAERGTPAHFFALFVLDLAGVPMERVELVDRGQPVANSIDLAALKQAARGQPAGAATRRYVLTTADATRLIPYVAIAPEGLVSTHPAALGALCSHWLTGVEELRRDVPAAARRIASIRGAPEALELLGLMGRIDSSTLRENAQVMGLSGRGAITVDSLFQHTWRVWRGADVVTSPIPETLPMNTEIVAALVRAGSSMADGAAGTLGEAEASRRPTGGNGQAQPLLVHRIEDRRFEDEDLIAKTGFLAGVFGPLPLRVAIRGDSDRRTQRVVEQARARFGLPGERISQARRITGRDGAAAIELLPPQ